MLCVSHGDGRSFNVGYHPAVDASECASAVYDECRIKAVRSVPDLDKAHVRAIFPWAAVSPMRYLTMTSTEHLCPWCHSPDAVPRLDMCYGS